MAYIGKTPTVGNFQICDAISVVNGQAAYTMQVGSANVSPESANHMIVSLSGVIQKPGSSYTVSGSTITFSQNLVTGDVIDFIQILGNVLDIGTPSDGAVTSAKLNYPLTTFSSTGIDDNASANALTIDSSSNLQFNSGFGSVATAYGVRVWLRYNQVNNAVSASGGVSSVTDTSTGSYIINFTNNMPDADYALGGWSGRNANPTVTGESNYHDVGNIKITTGDAVNNTWTFADVEDTTVIIVK